ncbi:DUF1365 domain-containing protein [Stagnimonas aquatica]|uniref:DUF1365 domain-containing protein n=1 Tax=Stagnimonas aquatica TaxID=2689987 RepID=A0A3N0VM76_9GAMM|nr:DUF1365 domain-containing protein [Stagnimonas aquatica]ROH93128.1 DUF1365 domain-containing protein [Stagnimonas aquatica]
MKAAEVHAEDGVLYTLRVMHRRRVAPEYRFVYRLFYLLLDIDRLPELDRRLRCFGYNRRGLISFHDRDHGRGEPGGLRRWAESVLAGQGVELAGGRIRLLTQPRMLGWGFNPVSFWYCEHADGRLRAVIAEVNNTFGERHSYVLTAASAEASFASADAGLPYELELTKEKCFHVSPLFDLRGRYHFRFSEPGQRLRVVLNETRDGAPLIDTAMAGERRELKDAVLLGQLLRMPVQAFKVVAAIHWQALKIWLRGAKFHRKPSPPDLEAT